MKPGVVAGWAGVAATVLLLACKASPPAATEIVDRPAPMPAAEIARGHDACAAYVKQVCACATERRAAAAGSGSGSASDATVVAAAAALTEQCKLAEGIPDAIALSLELANGSGVTRRDVLQAQQSVRQMIAECIEQTAMLPQRGCGI
ncbi:MAG: hypothetical protein KBG15_07145 [Kofleriaceae bacterium]|nr:hypothetical protein [Kofleriaceae bacterium]